MEKFYKLGPGLDSNYLTLMVFTKEFFEKLKNYKKEIHRH